MLLHVCQLEEFGFWVGLLKLRGWFPTKFCHDFLYEPAHLDDPTIRRQTKSRQSTKHRNSQAFFICWLLISKTKNDGAWGQKQKKKRNKQESEHTKKQLRFYLTSPLAPEKNRTLAWLGWQWKIPRFKIIGDTIPETNSSHLKVGHPKRKRESLPTIHFQVLKCC